MEKFKNSFFLLLGIAFLFWCLVQFLQQPAPAKYQKITENRQSARDNQTIQIGSNTIFVEIADTDEARTIGLSGRESLASGTGILFIFDNPGIYGFWMKDMRFPIDIVWIDENWKVIGVDNSVDPATFPTIFYPKSAAKFVLELNSGDAARWGIDAGLTLSPNH